MTRFILAALLLCVVAAGCARAGTRCCPVGTVRAEPIPTYSPPSPDGRDQFFIEMTCARIDVDALPNELGIPPGDGRTLVAEETEQGAHALKRRWREHDAVTVVQAPTILALAGDEASVHVEEAVGRPESRPAEDRYDLDPASLGTKIHVMIANGPSGSLQVEFHGAWRHMEVPQAHSTIASLEHAIRHVPTARADTTFELPDRGYVVIAAPRVEQPDGTYRMFTLLRASRLERPEADNVLIEMGPRVDGPEGPGR